MLEGSSMNIFFSSFFLEHISRRNYSNSLTTCGMSSLKSDLSNSLIQSYQNINEIQSALH